MKIVMTLLVHNEEDILEENLIFHKAMGVDFFIVTDHRSTDFTIDILNKYKDLGWLSITREESQTYNQGVWVTQMARKAYTEYAADWVINNDADEFWMPGTGDLRSYFEALPEETGKVFVNRLDFLYRPFRKAAFYEALLFREWMCRWKKCCHRGAPDIEIEIGNHGAYSKVLDETHPLDISASNGLRVLHYPLRSYERYKKKIIDGAQYMINTPGIPQESGFHWKNAFKHIAEGTFDQFFSNMVYSQDRIIQGIKDGQILMDDALQRFFLIDHKPV